MVYNVVTKIIYTDCDYTGGIRPRGIIICFQNQKKSPGDHRFKDDREAETIPTRWLITQTIPTRWLITQTIPTRWLLTQTIPTRWLITQTSPVISKE